VGQRRSSGVGDELLDDRVVAVLALGLQHLETGGDEHGVVPPGGEQRVLVLPDAVGFFRLTRRTISRPRTCRLAALEVNAVYATSATWACQTSSPVSVSTNASG
jgi:hypothetical protein